MDNLTEKQKEMVTQNTRLVNTIAERYTRTAQTYCYDDLVQCGYMGLLKAAETFDETKGVKFSTYAYQLIEYSILDAMRNTDRIIRVPGQMQTIAKEFKDANRKEKVTMSDFCKQRGISEKWLKSALLAMRPILYLEQPVVYSDDEFTTLMDLLTDDKNAAEASVQCNEVKQKVRLALEEMENENNPRGITILKSYYGIDTEEKTMYEIGQEYGLSAGRVGQIIKMMERKLRFHMRKEKELLETCEEFDMRDY